MTPGYYLAQHENGYFAWVRVYILNGVLVGQWGSGWAAQVTSGFSYDPTYWLESYGAPGAIDDFYNKFTWYSMSTDHITPISNPEFFI